MVGADQTVLAQCGDDAVESNAGNIVQALVDLVARSRAVTKQREDPSTELSVRTSESCLGA